MSQTCETCRYWKAIGQLKGGRGTCRSLPAEKPPLLPANAMACSLYRARSVAHVYQEPGEYNIKCTVTDPGADAGPGDEFTEGTECLHKPKGMAWGGFEDTTNTCAKCGKRIMRDLGPWRGEK